MKNTSVKGALPRMTMFMIVFLIILLLPINIALQVYMQHSNQKESAGEVFGQVQQLIEMNEKEIEQDKEAFSKRCIQVAEMAAYFVEHIDKTTWDLPHVRELAEKLCVDELHYFTPKGEIYFGTHPQYYGYTFHSGEQMEFFLPMLSDKTMKLCQDITPNTAEGKLMQYAAVWRSDGSGIVQIGMEPRRLMAIIEERSIENLIASLPVDLRGYLHVVDRDSMTIVASTVQNMVGINLQERMKSCLHNDGESAFHVHYNGKRFCVYTKTFGNYLFVRSYDSLRPIREISISSLTVLMYLVVIGGLVTETVSWYVNKKISNNLIRIVENLRAIEDGKMEDMQLKIGISEFDELIFYINQMMNSIQLSWNKLSDVIDKSDLPIGIFEYNRFYKRSFFNNRILSLLGIAGDPEKDSHEELGRRIREQLERMQQHPAGTEQGIFAYDRDHNGLISYFRIDKAEDNQSSTCYVTDVSLWWAEIHQLREQSNRDALTGLYNRRGFNDLMEDLFAHPEKIGYGMMVIIDADKLKQINDVYGHHVGDEYLIRIAATLKLAAGEKAPCARLGGDEFAVFLHQPTAEALHKALERIASARGMPFFSERLPVQGTLEFSLGCASYPADGTDYHVLMHIADENMYREKRERRTPPNGG